MVSIYEIAQMTETGDVKGLSRIFQRAGDWDTRETVVVALGNIVWGQGGDFDHAEMREVLRKIEQVCEAESGGGSYRINCLTSAGKLLTKLEESLQDSPTSEPKAVERKVSMVKYDQAEIRRLIKLLGFEASWETRYEAARVLEELGDKRAVKPLIAALKDRASRFLRSGAADVLGRLGDKRAVEPLIGALEDVEDVEYVRWSVAEALGKLGSAQAVKPLIAALKDEDSMVRGSGEAGRHAGSEAPHRRSQG